MFNARSAIRIFRIGLTIGFAALTACNAATARSTVVKTASFDHDCPKENIRVLAEDTDVWAYRLNVCGRVRKYRDMGDNKQFQFVDVTDGQPAPAKP